MSNRLYVGNLSYDTTSASLRAFFEAAGEVKSAEIILDRETQRSKGFGFVEMATAEQAQVALETLNGRLLDSRPVRIDLARPKEARPRTADASASPRSTVPPAPASTRQPFSPARPAGGGRSSGTPERDKGRSKRSRESDRKRKSERPRRGDRFDKYLFEDEEEF